MFLVCVKMKCCADANRKAVTMPGEALLPAMKTA